MSRQTMMALALGTVALAVLPLAQAAAESGPSNIDRICAAHGLAPQTADFDVCVNRVASALDHGQPGQADREAALVRSAKETCSAYGVPSSSLSYRGCVRNEIERHSAQPARYQPSAGSATKVDSYGFRYDSEGNLFDPDGYPIRPVP
ncbi:hypothetical protein SAMN02745126_01998 [Enhydrobacter aerosaccus]|uniref:Uncharacterized protein n=1 Tax=Enhydrobacter aerosaccus TaxID=225324 RepID=A0A1T4MW57_9HYPH|nr:hypothetical protein [Enhydrobacter aerosaccus]SJZ71340.1 hypothetical protein SAMN02745126_01998 [Enhydrobacter aerosaccus]